MGYSNREKTMKKTILILLAASALAADMVIPLSKGWQLAGASRALDDLSPFSEGKALVVWAYDAGNAQWQGYAPGEEMTAKLADKNVSALESLEAWQGFWVYSSDDWTMTVEESAAPGETRADEINVYAGWNLLSLPVNQVVSPALFGEGATIWKYESNAWQVSGEESELYPPATTLGAGEGFWLYSEETKTIPLGDVSSQPANFATEEAMTDYIREMAMMHHRGYYRIWDYPMEGGNLALDDGGFVTDTDADNGGFSSSGTSGSTGTGGTGAPTANGGEETADTSGGNDKAADDATGTNLQEEGVDESDIVKNDGTYVYYLSMKDRTVAITSFSDLAAGVTEPKAVIALGETTPDSMYLDDGKLVILSNNYYYGFYDYDEAGIAKETLPAESSRNRVLVDVYDLTDPVNPVKSAALALDGSLNDSRMIDGALYLVANFSPEITIEYPKTAVSDCDSYSYGKACWGVSWTYEDGRTRAYRYDYDNPEVTGEYLLPYGENSLTEESFALLAPERFWAPMRLDQPSSITYVAKIDPAAGTVDRTAAILGYAQERYASSEALYVTTNRYPLFFDFYNYEERLTLYKFRLGDDLDYVATGTVNGHTLNQFSMSEKDDILRIATTDGFSWGGGDTANRVYTLEEAAGSLNVKGRLEGLGKEGETIRGVRFVGDRGFVVTFLQTDPLYTLDLSDPANPTKVGELEIPGFSSYFHPVDDDRILAVGRDADAEGRQQGVQIQLFDISDFANPALADKITIGDSGTYSEAADNHKAFTWRSSDETFALPVGAWSPVNFTYSDALQVYRLDGLAIDALGAVEPEATGEKSYSYSAESRGVLFTLDGEDYAAYFNGNGFTAQKLTELTQ